MLKRAPRRLLSCVFFLGWTHRSGATFSLWFSLNPQYKRNQLQHEGDAHLYLKAKDTQSRYSTTHDLHSISPNSTTPLPTALLPHDTPLWFHSNLAGACDSSQVGRVEHLGCLQQARGLESGTRGWRGWTPPLWQTGAAFFFGCSMTHIFLGW